MSLATLQPGWGGDSHSQDGYRQLVPQCKTHYLKARTQCAVGSAICSKRRLASLLILQRGRSWRIGIPASTAYSLVNRPTACTRMGVGLHQFSIISYSQCSARREFLKAYLVGVASCTKLR